MKTVAGPISSTTLAWLVMLSVWFALDFVGVPGLVDKEPLISLAGLMLGVLAVVLLLGALRARFSAALFAVTLLIWAGLQVETHWSTYFLFDASDGKLRWYNNVFGTHWRVLPEIQRRTTPDAYHTVLAGLILVNLLQALRDMRRHA